MQGPFTRVVLLCTLFCASLYAANESAVTGSVVNAGGEPVADAVIEVVGMSQRWKAKSDGAFQVVLPPGDHRLLVTSARYGTALVPVTVSVATSTSVDVRLSPVYRDEMVVSAGTEARPISEIAQPIAVLSGERLDARQQPS